MKILKKNMLIVMLLLSGPLYATEWLNMVEGEPVVVDNAGIGGRFDEMVCRFLPDTLGGTYKKLVNKNLGLQKSGSFEIVENEELSGFSYFSLPDGNCIAIDGNQYNAFTQLYELEEGRYYRYMQKQNGGWVKMSYKENPEIAGHPVLMRAVIVCAALGVVTVTGKVMKYIYGKLLGFKSKKLIENNETSDDADGDDIKNDVVSVDLNEIG